MFERDSLSGSRTREILRGPGFVIAFASFVAGIVLYGALAFWIDGTRNYAWSGQRKMAVNALATLLCLGVLSGVAAAITLATGR